MNSAQQETILSAVVVSSSTHWAGQPISSEERKRAFSALQEFSTQFEGRIPLCLQWLQQPKLAVANGTIDCTVQAQLYACEILSSCLNDKTKKYAQWQEGDRLQLRQAVLVAAQHQADAPLVLVRGSADNSNRSLPLANKLASLLSALVVRDFPQRWTTCIGDLFGQLWSETTPKVGNRMCLQVLQLVAEDCTDSDFNSKISTQRRNDILLGLNEVSHQFLPLLFRSLEHIATLTQARTSIHQMRLFLLQNQMRVSTMTPEQSAAYWAEDANIRGTSLVITDTLRCVHIFCRSMPLEWIMSSQHDFTSALFHLMRESTENINVLAVNCLEQLALRGKLTYSQWTQWVRDLPQAVAQANQHMAGETEYLQVQEAASTGSQSPPDVPDLLTLQSEYHRALSRMLATVVSSHIGLITQDKGLLKSSSGNSKKKNTNSENLESYLRLLVDLLHHPSGRVVGEQIALWVGMLRDPQISKSSSLLDPLVADILNCFTNHMIKLDWDDVEDEKYPQSDLIQASWEDEDDYDAWSHDYRAKASLLFKYIGNCQPHIAASVLLTRVRNLITQHGNGEPLDHLCVTNQQITDKSTASRQFEGIVHPMENILNGLPTWSLNAEGKSSSFGSAKKQEHQKQLEGQIRAQTQASLSELANGIVSWNPSYLWLKFRRAQLLESLKHYWKHDPSTLLQGVNSLLGYIGAPDEWGETKVEVDGTTRLSGETVGFRKKSSMSLVGLAKMVPHHLVPWLSELSNASRSLLSQPDLLQTNRMNLYEFLSVVATAVKDPLQRANFIGSVLGDALTTLQSPETQEALSSVDNFAAALGIAQAGNNPASVTDIANVKTVTDRFQRLFSSFNELLSVGKRCHEAAKKRVNGGIPVAAASGATNINIPKGMSVSEAAVSMRFPDEGPVSINDLAVDDPFVPLWPQILPHMLRMLNIIFKMWQPGQQAVFLRNPIQRYALAISDDDAFLSRKTDGKTGGVFGEGGTAGSIIPGTDRRDMNLAPRWSGWLNEMRNSMFQMLGLLAGQRVLYAPEVAEFYPQLVAVVTDPDNLRAMEHRHCAQYLKQFIEILLLSCPPPLYSTHLSPIIAPVLEHVQYRLEKTWEPILQPTVPLSCKPLFTSDCEAAAVMASQGGEAWYTSYYARSGLFVGGLDAETAEGSVEKHRVEITRFYSDVIQSALALKGDWALVLANLAKESEGTSYQGKKGPPTSRLIVADGGTVNADGTPRKVNQTALDARKMQRIHALNHFLLLENETIAGYLTLSVIQSLSYPDTYTCRRITRICHRILETVAWHPNYTDLLGRRMLAAITKNVVTQPKWMVGTEWDVINVFRDIYCRLVLGQMLQMGGQGPGLQQPPSSNRSSGAVYEQAKSAERPLQGGGILTAPSELPHQLLSSLSGISVAMIQKLDQDLMAKRSAKAQKDIIRDFLRVAADGWSENQNPNNQNVLDRAVAAESLLHNANKSAVVEDIPEKLVLSNRKSRAQKANEESVGMSAFSLTH
eukprot:jgi/Psemu1/250511/estExt_Genewise1Plus.C_180109